MKRVTISFEVPNLILEDMKLNGDTISPDGVTLYAIKVDTDLKHTLLDLCVRESVRQEVKDAQIFVKAEDGKQTFQDEVVNLFNKKHPAK